MYFIMLPVPQNLELDGKVTDAWYLEWIYGLIEVLFWHLHVGAEET
jgi:hypothetical protein